MMPSYLERYLNGEREQVWNELIALGESVRQEPLYSDARAVAQETMRRVRRNIETLYQRLQSIGFQFDCERSRSGKNPLAGLRDQLANNPLMNSILGNMVGEMEGLIQSLGEGQPASPPRAYKPPESDIVQQLDEFEQLIGKIPLSVRAWCEIVGSVDFVGDYPGLASYNREEMANFDLRGMVRGMLLQNPHILDSVEDTDETVLKNHLASVELPFPQAAMLDMHKLIREESEAIKAEGLTTAPQEKETWWMSDPLAFHFEMDAEEARWQIEEESEENPGQYELMVAPDIYHKANFSGSTYDILLPDASADTLLHGTDKHFVAYLRHSFAWGGFPGLEEHEERDEKLLTFLRAGLEPL
jgi:hypothetical protein